ncbi:MAG: restriction endonuclease subunit S [Candidatus Thiodiazotropha endolucinida]
MEQLAFPRYDAYKPSGVDWLGDIPEAWSIERIRAVTELKSKKNQPDLPVLSVYREYGVIPKDSRDDNHNATSLDTSNYKVVKSGDLVVNKMKAWQGSMGVSEHQGIVSPAYITCSVDAEHVRPKFLHYLLRSKPYIGVYNSLSYGVRVGQWDMHYEDFKHIPLPIPSRDEQDRIANFLDQKTAEIDEAIAKKQRLIELLKEQKAILINQAVTKGLNPGVPMRDSGVEWIGEVPEHWKAKKVKAMLLNLDHRRIPLSSVERGSMERREYDYYGASGIIDKVEDYLFDEPLILVAEDGANLVLRNLRLAFIAKGKYWVNNHAHILKPIEGDIEYLCSALECVDFNPFITGAAQPKLTKDAIKNVSLPCPPLEEQREIGRHIGFIEAGTQEQEALVEKEVDLLRELKATLISEAVTGKIKL